MKPVKLFGLLCFGYAGIWITVLISIASNVVGDGRGFLDAFFTSLFVPLIFLYPAFAVGFIFNQQSKLLRWKVASILSAITASLISCWIMWDFIDGGFAEYAGLGYFLISAAIGTFSGVTFTGLGCVSKHQKSITRFLGVLTLFVVLYWPIYAFFLQKWVQVNYPGLNTFELFVFLPFWLQCAIAFSALSSAVFLGLKQERVSQ